MEISGLGGYRDGMAARSSITSAPTIPTEGDRRMEKPAAVLSEGGVDNNQQDEWRPTVGVGYRASEPLLLDFDLPTSTARENQRAQQKQKRSSSSKMKRRSASRLDNLQPSVHLCEKRRAEYKQALEDRVARALCKSQAAWEGTSGIFDDNPKDWKLHVSKPNLTMYRHRRSPDSDESASTTPHRFIGRGRVPGATLEDIEYGLYADTTLDERALGAYWFSDYFLDAGVIEVYETRTDDDPFAFFGAKWLLTGPLDRVQLIAPRISAFVQYQKTAIDELGNKVLVRVVDSVPEDIVPLIPDQGGVRFVPFDFAIVYMYRYDPKSESVQVFCEGRIAAMGWMANVSITMLSTVIVHLEHIADAKYITKHGLMFPQETTSPTSRSTIALSVSTHLQSPMASSSGGDARLPQITPGWVPDRKRKLCFVCSKSFGILKRHRHHCRMCGEVMCAECMVTLPLVAPERFSASEDANFPLQNQPPSKKLEDTNRRGLPVVHRFKFCQTCLLAIRQERCAMVAGVGNYYFAEGMRLNYARMQAAFAEFDDDAIESGYLDSSLGENESIVDEIQYSLRIEKLRQEHMEREKQKLRDQQKNFHQVRGVSVRLLDESTASLPALSSSASRTPRVSNLNDSTSRLFSSTMPVPTSTSDTFTTTTNSTRRLPINSRRRSFSIPDHFVKMERSIAEQEALISSIQQQRTMVKNSAQHGQSSSRLPIGDVMRSIAQMEPSVLSRSSEE
ncbi:1-phosphatidylinositol 3-phosphate 5-kinase [Globisporangium polare]